MRGNISEDEGLIDAPIARDLRNRQRMAVRAGGRGAQTRFWVRERFGDWTLVEALLLTGRTHQLRVHFASIGHPVAGDTTYGSTIGHRPASSASSCTRACCGCARRTTTTSTRLRGAPAGDLADTLERLRRRAAGTTA